MKIQVSSDLHTEYWKGSSEGFPKVEGEVLVLPGDIGNVSSTPLIKTWLSSIEIPVIWVLGNHEYYSSDLHTYASTLKKEFSDLPHVHILDAESRTIEGVTFIGATLWTHLRVMDEFYIRGGMKGDFSCIKGLTVIEWKRRFKREYEYIKQVLINTRGSKRVVVTHHSPSFRGVSPRFKGDALNAGFHSHLDELILDEQPEAWLHGHTHTPLDYQIRNTRVVCNPYGYPGELTSGLIKRRDLQACVKLIEI